MKPPLNVQYIFIGLFLSIIALVFLVVVSEEFPSFFDIEVHWIAFSLIPLVLALLMGGWIKSVSALGVEINTALEAPISTETPFLLRELSESVYTTRDNFTVEKGPVMDLMALTRNKESVQFLRFTVGRPYNKRAIAEYINSFPNLRFFELVDEREDFLGYFPVEKFLPRPFLEDDHTTDFLMAVLDDDKDQANVFANLAEWEVKNIFLKERVFETEPLQRVLDEFLIKKVRVLALFRTDGTYVGPILPEQASQLILQRIYEKNPLSK